MKKRVKEKLEKLGEKVMAIHSNPGEGLANAELEEVLAAVEEMESYLKFWESLARRKAAEASGSRRDLDDEREKVRKLRVENSELKGRLSDDFCEGFGKRQGDQET